VTDPTRADVEARWLDILARRRSREVVHDWTQPWVEGEGRLADPLVSIGMTYLHGYDLSARPGEPHLVRHGIAPGRAYCKPEATIADELAAWQQSGALFDSGPATWRRERGLR
jgi:hypothetical protein